MLLLCILFICSKDKQSFVIPRVVAVISGTINRLLTDPGEFRELTGPMHILEFDNIDGATMQACIKYMFYKHHNRSAVGEIPPFPIDTASALPLMAASKYLEL